mmetsp:Transcript_52657/g.87499  ORF Transcript_52657/g.87499 Transcript_52657/m.87499 type:complete len:213 (-) Transcript_52657:334-972(-)
MVNPDRLRGRAAWLIGAKTLNNDDGCLAANQSNRCFANQPSDRLMPRFTATYSAMSRWPPQSSQLLPRKPAARTKNPCVTGAGKYMQSVVIQFACIRRVSEPSKYIASSCGVGRIKVGDWTSDASSNSSPSPYSSCPTWHDGCAHTPACIFWGSWQVLATAQAPQQKPMLPHLSTFMSLYRCSYTPSIIGPQCWFQPNLDSHFLPSGTLPAL